MISITLLLSPLSDSVRMLWVMTVCVQSQAMPERSFRAKLFLMHGFDEIHQAAMRVLEFSPDVDNSERALLLGHQPIERIDSAVCYRVSRWFAALENRRQMLQRFLLPCGHVSKNVTN